jgi:atrazine chlorohydrolase/5-methylthioadenosine/S-adenosylhomocysteine deaminase/melamine deaminase
VRDPAADVDLALVGGTVLPMVRNARETLRATVLVRDGQIVGLTRERRPKAREVIDATGKLVMPGFVNAHCHGIHLLMRGLSDGLRYHEWLEQLMYRALPAYRAQDALVASKLFCAEAIRSGITTIGDSTDFGNRADLVEATLAGIDAAGMRALYFRNFSDAPPRALRANREPAGRALADIEALIARRATRNPLVCIGAGVNEPHFVTPSAFRRAVELVEAHDTRLMVHLAEVEADVLIDGANVVDWMRQHRLLSPKLVAAHCVWLRPPQLRKLAAAGVSITWQPSTNAFLADGVMPLRDVLAAGITVGLGTDDSNASDHVNMFTEMRTGAMVTKLRERDGTAVSPDTMLAIATRGGARVLGLDAEVGAISVGRAADLIVIDLAQLAPYQDLASALVYQATGAEVETVVIGGRVVMRDRMLTTLDEVRLRREAAKAAAGVVERGGVAARRVEGATEAARYLFAGDVEPAGLGSR